MQAVKAFLGTIRSVSDWIGYISAFLIPVMMLVMTYEVVARYLFNSPTIWVMETSQYLYLASTALGGAFLLLNRGHVNVSLLYRHLGVRARAIVDILTSMGFFLFVGALFYSTWSVTVEAVSNLEKSPSYWEPPIYPVYIIMTCGIAMTLLQGMVKLIEDCATAYTGRAGLLGGESETDSIERI